MSPRRMPHLLTPFAKDLDSIRRIVESFLFVAIESIDVYSHICGRVTCREWRCWLILARGVNSGDGNRNVRQITAKNDFVARLNEFCFHLIFNKYGNDDVHGSRLYAYAEIPIIRSLIERTSYLSHHQMEIEFYGTKWNIEISALYVFGLAPAFLLGTGGSNISAIVLDAMAVPKLRPLFRKTLRK